MKTYIYRTPISDPNARRELVATFPTGMEPYANSAKWRFETVSVPPFDQFTYIIEYDAPKLASLQLPTLQVDLSQARPSRRRLVMTFSWFPQANNSTMCDCLAYTHKHGTIRGSVTNTPGGRLLFLNRVHAIWPEAYIETK